MSIGFSKGFFDLMRFFSTHAPLKGKKHHKTSNLDVNEEARFLPYRCSMNALEMPRNGGFCGGCDRYAALTSGLSDL